MEYAGIGSRETPNKVLTTMKSLGIYFAMKGITLSTGAAKGADQAFAEGAAVAGGEIKLYLPWGNYEREFVNRIPCSVIVHKGDNNFDIVEKLHPAGKRLKPSVKKLHARNVSIIEGCSFVVCWTPDGKATGGTGMGIRIAFEMNIPVYNLYNPDDVELLKKLIEKLI
jgi:predicted Rossmann-fold nucleotide-binding protein